LHFDLPLAFVVAGFYPPQLDIGRPTSQKLWFEARFFSGLA
jgi:hypothetical protein